MDTVSYTHLDVYKRQILQGKTDEDLRTFIVEALDKREPFYSQEMCIRDSPDGETHCRYH